VSLIELILSDQRQLNVLLSKMDELTSKQLRGDIVTRGVDQNITEEVIDARTGRKQIKLPAGIDEFQIFKYDQNMQLGQVSLERIFQDLHNKTGQSQPSLGQTLDKRVTVGELQIAREGDFASLHWHLNQINRHLAEVAQQKLQLAHEYYKQYTLINQFDGPGRPSNMSDYFLGADLRDTRDVIYIPQPHLTPAMKRQTIMEAYEKRLTGPYESDEQQLAARILLKYMGIPELDEELERVYGPIEQLEGYVQMMQNMKRQIIAQQAQAALQMSQQPQGQPGQPGQSGQLQLQGPDMPMQALPQSTGQAMPIPQNMIGA
jgi:hypothetical protein